MYWTANRNPLVTCRGHFGSWKSCLECCGEQRTWFKIFWGISWLVASENKGWVYLNGL